ncbi:hypothetical protein GUITHDRAFT_152157, partial [Guillardia theta CCMP2712]
MTRPGPAEETPSRLRESSRRVSRGSPNKNLPVKAKAEYASKNLLMSTEEDRTSNASTADKHDSDFSSGGSQHSDGEMPRGDYRGDEIDAASSLATIILAGNGSKKRGSSSIMFSPKDSQHDSDADPVSVKKQRRREKNRASAQQSRQRKKHHLETLECRVDVLEQEKAALALRLESLLAENKKLRGQLAL